MNEKQAIAILIGAGVVIDMKRKTQIYKIGTLLTDKIAKAGAALDAITEKAVVKGKVHDVPVWKTKWLRSEDFVIEHKAAKKERSKKAESEVK